MKAFGISLLIMALLAALLAIGMLVFGSGTFNISTSWISIRFDRYEPENMVFAPFWAMLGAMIFAIAGGAALTARSGE